jgi:RNA polymerase sigma-70 factor (ECF subfamily)
MDQIQEPILKNLATFVAFARKRVGDPHLAEDLVQESLLKALQAGKKPSPNEDVIAWFYRILRRSIIDLYRRTDARKRALENFRAELPTIVTPEAERAICQCLNRLLPDLPDQYRELLERVDLGGETIKEAAAALGVTVNNLTVRLHRARRQMRDRLEQFCRDCSTAACVDCSCD